MKELRTKFGDSFTVDLASFLEWHLWAFGSYEPQFSELFRKLIQPGDRCIDVGANIGVHTVRLAKLVGARGEVIAIEPDEDLALRTTNNLLLNNLTNVQVIRAAAAKRGGNSVLLYKPDVQDPNKGRASLLPHSYLTGSAKTVPTTTIDEIARMGTVALIKIDVEGCETDVVSGARRTIETYSPSIIFEYAPELIRSNSCSPFEWLREHNYKLFRIRQKRNVLTGRGNLELEFLEKLPDKGTDILAVCRSIAPRVNSLVRAS